MTHSSSPKRKAYQSIVDSIVLLALGTSFFVLFPFAAISGDQARDLEIAAAIIEGKQFPSKGPLLAGLFHLGPVWFYLLAGLQALGLHSFGIHLVMALLAAMQFPLVYRAGCWWKDRSTGLLWASLLLVPSWGLYEQIFPGHTSLTGVCTAAVLLVSIRLLRTKKTGEVYLLAFLTTLAVHAHPTAVLLLPLPVICALAVWRSGRVSAWHLAGSLMIPFSMVLPAMLIQDWSLADSLLEYAASGQGQGSVRQIGPLAWQLSGGSLHYWLQEVGHWPSMPALVVAVTWASLLAAGLLGAMHRAWHGDRIGRLLLTVLALAILGLALGRAIFPFYMFGSVRILLLGIAAFGLAGWVNNRSSDHIVAVVALGIYWCVAIPAGVHLDRGNWPFAFIPLFHATGSWSEPVTLGLTNTTGMQAGGAWLCANDAAAMHGAWGQMLLISRAVEARLACGLEEVVVGGADASRAHWIGLSASMAAQIGKRAQHQAGSWRIFPVRQIVHSGPGIGVPTEIPHPPEPVLPLPDDRVESLRLSIQPHERNLLAVSNIAFGVAPPPRVQLHCADTTLRALASDAVTTVFPMKCTHPLELVIETRAPKHLNVIEF